MSNRTRFATLWCRLFGHDWSLNYRGEGDYVIGYSECDRCGIVGRERSRELRVQRGIPRQLLKNTP